MTCGPKGFCGLLERPRVWNRNLVISVQVGIETLGNKIPTGSGGGARLLKGGCKEARLWLPGPGGKASRRGVEAFQEERC